MRLFSLCGREREAIESLRDLCCARMRNERVLVLLLPRNVVRLSDHFRGPPHGLPECQSLFKITDPEQEVPRAYAPGYSRALVSLR